MNNQKLRFIVDYIWATENEISIDKSVYALSGVSPEELNYAPRPAKVLNRFIRNRKFFKLLIVILKIIWRFGGAATYFLYEMMIYYRYSTRCTSKLNQCRDVGEYAIAFSSRAADILQPTVLGFEPKCWITFPWAPLNVTGQSKQYVDVFSLLNGKDFISAYILAVIASRKLASRKQTLNWTLQSYTAFRWFVVRIALEKLNINRLLIAEHYDRWAVLTDRVISKQLRRPSLHPENRVELVLMQHGALSGLTLAECKPQVGLSFELKHRLTSVTKLHVYDDSSRMVFETDIFSAGCVARGVAVNYFQPTIELTRLSSTNAIKILFVGHPICEALHVHIYKKLKHEYSASFYYKPHPTAGLSESVKREDWQIIEGRNSFPEVDFLIAYPSTLVSEYAASGISAVLHSLDLGKDFSAGLLGSVKSKLDTLACKKRV
ncbi:hypothetical protein ACYZTM_06380 [Pseudomonas sp. MDT2-39-1]